VLSAIFDRLAAIERQQRVHTDMLNNLLQAVAKRDVSEACVLPDNVVLPLESKDDLTRLEKKLVDRVELKTLLVCFAINALYLLPSNLLLFHLSDY